MKLLAGLLREKESKPQEKVEINYKCDSIFISIILIVNKKKTASSQKDGQLRVGLMSVKGNMKWQTEYSVSGLA